MIDIFNLEETYLIKKAICIISQNLHTHGTMSEEDENELKKILNEFEKSVKFWEGEK